MRLTPVLRPPVRRECLVAADSGECPVPRRLAVGLAVLLVAMLANRAVAANPTAGGLLGTVGEDLFTVTGTNNDDDIQIVIEEWAEGSVCPGDPEADPEIPAVPEEDIVIIQIYDRSVAPAEAMFQVVGANCGTLAGVTAAQVIVDGFPLTDNIETIRVLAGGGVDIIDASALGEESPVTELNGGPGDDVIFGGQGEDFISGDDGNDILNGGAGDDVITGGAGNDLVRGDQGADQLGGGGGFDVLDYATDAGGAGVLVDFSVLPGTAIDGWGDEDTIGNEASTGFAAIRGKNSDDLLIGHAGDTATTIVGNGGNDTIIGGAAADVLIGDDGDDRIVGNGGSDIIIGGPGSDTIFGDNEDGGGDGADIISGDGTPDGFTQAALPAFPLPVIPTLSDPVAASDGIEDRPWLWWPLGTARVLPLITGRLWPPAPGWPAAPLPAGTVLVPSTGDDLIRAGAGVDRVYGGAGNDTIYGEGIEFNDEGGDSDILFGDYDYDLDNDGLFEFGDPLVTPGNDTIWGEGGQDLITGGAGGDTLIGGAGDDVISGNDGSDYIVGGPTYINNETGLPTTQEHAQDEDFDTVDYTASLTGIILDLGSFDSTSPSGTEGSATGDGLGTDTLIGIENVIGSPFDDVIRGSDVDEANSRRFNLFVWDVNRRTVFSGSLLVGVDATSSGFDNILIGGAGNDQIFGMRGNDAIIGDDSNDNTIDGNDVLRGDDGLEYEHGNDFIWGCGGDDTLFGEGGDDVLFGGVGADTISGGAGNDILDYTQIVPGFTGAVTALEPVRVNLSHIAFNGQPPDSASDGGRAATFLSPAIPASIDTIVNGRANPRDRIEIVRGSNFDDGTAAIDDVIVGHEALPTSLYGMAGDDHIVGGSDNDYIDGGTGDDLIEGDGVLVAGRVGDDTLVGGNRAPNELDTVTYVNAPGAVTVSLLDTRPQQTSGAGLDKLIGFRNLTGSAFDDTLTGDALSNVVSGGSGNDLLTGRGDQDEPDPLNGNLIVQLDDTLDGGPGTDTADYRTGDPSLVTVDLGLALASNDGEGGRDVLVSIESALRPDNALFVTAGPDKIVSPGGRAQLEGAASGGATPYTYAWTSEPVQTPVPGLDDPTKAQPMASPTTTMTYRLTVTDAAGKVGSDFVKVTVTTVITVKAGADRTISLGDSVQLSGSVTGGQPPYTVLWTPAEGLSATNIFIPVASPNVTTAYTLKVTDALDKYATDTVTVTVTNPFSISAGADRTIDAGANTVLNVDINGGSPPYQILWTPAIGLSSTTVANPVASPAVSTTYTVTVEDANGRRVTDSVLVTVLSAAPAQPPAGNAGGDTGGTGGTGGTGETPRTSPPEGEGTQSPVPVFGFCGMGVSSGFLAVNMLLLLSLKRRRWTR
ncbi:MAG: hypothetical protein AMXMBFR13_34730 [Phycisphaerae bacterium]